MTSDSDKPPPDRLQALLAEYAEVASNFRLLTDIRFKLLAFLPIAAAAAAALKGTASADTTTVIATLGLGLFGLIVTAGLVSYNLRNDQLYNELVGRAANIERSLGVPDGAFANRPGPWLSLRLPFGRVWHVAHGSSVALIYAASVTLWLFIVLFSLIQLPYDGDTPSWWATAAVLLVAIAIVAGAVRWIAAENRVRRGAMRAAIGYAFKLASGGFDEAARSQDFLTLCAGLRDKDAARSKGFWTLLEGLPREDGEPDWLRRHPKPTHKGDKRLEQAKRTVQERAEYYESIKDNHALGSHYGLLPPEASPSREAYFVGLITDLPPRWIYDVAKKRV